MPAKSTGHFGLAHFFNADNQALRTKLERVPNEVRGTSDTIYLPMPDGSLAKFSIVESSNMEDGLAEEFPQIKSYRVYGIDDPSASGRVDISPNGFRGMVMTSQGQVFIDPVNNTADASRYKSKLRTGSYSETDQPFQCDVHTLSEKNNGAELSFSRNDSTYRVSGSLTSYRLAVSATSEYVTAVGGTLISTMAEINTAINRVNQIYERDLGVHFNLIANNSLIIEVTPADFGFSNNNGSALLNQNQTKIDSAIGSSNYDIGHVFSTGGGGVAQLGSVCGSSKAGGVTGLPNPTGDGFYIDYVAHEIGHQFGGNHTFNASTNNCSSGNLNASTAFEPGSGSTIMGYAGICGAENIAAASDSTFHAGSIAEINSFVAATGATCATYSIITPANSDPSSVNAGIDRVIPVRTPFRLTASAVDEGDILSYQWDQMNAGTAVTNAATVGTDQGTNPLFKSQSPKTTSIRELPTLSSQINATSTISETLPTTARTLNFRVTVRDSRTGQGTDDIAVTVDSGSGPFAITSHTAVETFAATAGATVTWNSANTNNSPVNCSNVDIKLYTFSNDKSTYGISDLLLSTPNDGTESVTIPNKANAQSRFSVSCSDNIFYDLSDADLNITGTGTFVDTGFFTSPAATGFNIPSITNFVTSSKTITIGSSVNLTATFANGTASIDNGVGTVTSNAAKSVSPSSTTTYTLTVTHLDSTAVSAAVTVTVTSAPASTSGGGGAFGTLLLKFLFGILLMVFISVTARQPKALKL